MIRNILLTAFVLVMIITNGCATSPAVVNFKLNPHQRIGLVYKNALFEELKIEFINESDKDSVITHTVDLPTYTVLYYGMSLLKSNAVEIVQNTIYLKNGETVSLETDEGFQLISNTNENPTVNSMIRFRDSLSSNGSSFYPMLKDNINAYYTKIDNINLANHQRIDSIFERKEISIELKKLLDLQAETEYHSYIVAPMIYNVMVPLAYSKKITKSAEKLRIQPAIIDNLDLQQSLNLFNTYCRYEIKRAGHKVNLETLATQAFKSKWAQPLVIAYLAQCMDLEKKKDGPTFKNTFQKLSEYVGTVKSPQFMQLQKKYFPVINYKDKIILLKDDGSTSTFAAELEKNRGRLIVIDFWASWCVPCRQAFPDLQKMKAKFSNRKVTFIGLSLDADTKTDDWITALKQEKLYGETNQFKLKNIKTSPLFDGISIESIPRYLVLNGKGEILNSDFHGPQDEKFAVLLNNYIQQEMP